MSRLLIEKILRGRSDASIRFTELRALLRDMGFTERIRGSRHIYRKPGVTEKIDLQCDGSHAKPYRVRQVRRTILKYRLGGDD